MKFDKIQLGDVTYVSATRVLLDNNGSAVQLRHKSKEVLRVLIERAGETIGKNELLDQVWSDVTVSDESLVQCIADIRRVIGGDARQIVETVPREGYRLNVQSDAETTKSRQLLPALGLAAAVSFVLVAWFEPWSSAQQETTSAEEVVRVLPPGTDVTEAYLEVLQGRVSADRFSESESLIAERHFRKAIDLDPSYARAYAELGILFAVRFENDWTVLEDADKSKALFYAQKAVELNPDLWLTHYALGRLQSILGDIDQAEAQLERAMALQPDNEDARAYLGIVKNFKGNANDAIAILERALASHPNPPYWYHLGLGNALFNADQFEEAASALNACLDLAENSPYCLRYLIAVYGAMGRTEEAQTTSRAYAEVGFDPSISSIMDLMTFHTAEDRSKLESAFRKAELPE